MKTIKLLVASAVAALAFNANAAVVIITDTSVTNSIPGLTGFNTFGSQMDGLKVTANFSGGLSQTLNWADTGATSGGVVGTNWSLSLNGDSFNQAWQFAIDPVLGQLLSFVLDASGPNQVTVFDTFFGGVWGTANSVDGKDFACAGCNATATYSNAVAVSPGAAVGDTYHTLSVNFDAGTGPRTNFSFIQDTDNDSRLVTGFVPEPGTVPMILLALGAMGMALRRRR